MVFLLIRTCGPNKLMVKTGVGYGDKPKIIKGGSCFQIVCFHQIQRLSLNIMTIKIKSANVNCSNGVQISADGVAQCKINADDRESIDLALQNFMSLSKDKIRTVLNETLEGQQRSIISKMTVEEMYQDREKFNSEVFEGAKQDLLGMGINLISYTVSSISTRNGYLRSLAQPTISAVHRDARIGEAECQRDAEIVKNENKRLTMETEYKVKQEIEMMTNNRDMIMEENKKAVNTVKAVAENAKRLAVANVNKDLVAEQQQIRLIERQGDARVKEQDILFKEQQLQSQVLLRAETDKYKTEVNAEADKVKKILQNEAEAAEVEVVGEAEAEAIKIKAEAHARTTKLKAEAYEKFGQAAMVGEVLKTLPQMAAEISRPAMDMNKLSIVSAGNGPIGFTRVTTEIMEIMKDIPKGVNDITGVDFTSEIKKVMARG